MRTSYRRASGWINRRGEESVARSQISRSCGAREPPTAAVVFRPHRRYRRARGIAGIRSRGRGLSARDGARRVLATYRDSGALWTASLVADRVLPSLVRKLWRDVPVDADTLAAQVAAILRAWTIRDADAAIIVEHLLYADLHGIDSHGCAMLRAYQRDLDAGAWTPHAAVEVVHESATTALVDGGGGLGHVPATPAMKLAIAKCRGARRRRGRGAQLGPLRRRRRVRGAWRARAGLIGLATTSTRVPAVVPTFGVDAMLGTNPIAFAAPAARNPAVPARHGDQHRAARQARDRWRTAAARSRAAGRSIAAGVPRPTRTRAVDAAAPDAARRHAAHGSHKGYGLATMVEILSAVAARHAAPVAASRRHADGRRALLPRARSGALPPRRRLRGRPRRAARRAARDAAVSIRREPVLRRRRSRVRGRGRARARRHSARARAWSRTSARVARARRRPLPARRETPLVIRQQARRLYGNAIIAAYLPGQTRVPFLPRERRSRRRDRARAAHRRATRRARCRTTATSSHARGIDPRTIRGAADLDRLPILDRELVRTRAGALPRRRAGARAARSSFPPAARPARRCDVAHDRRSLLANIPFGERERAPVNPALRRLVPAEGALRRLRDLDLQEGDGLLRREHAPADRARSVASSRCSRPIEEIAAIANAERPDVLVGYGGWLDLFFRTRRRARHRAAAAEDGHVHGRGAAARRARATSRTSFGIPVMSRYNAVESFKIGYFCERRTGFHLHEDLCHVRIARRRRSRPGARRVGPRRAEQPRQPRDGAAQLPDRRRRGAVAGRLPVRPHAARCCPSSKDGSRTCCRSTTAASSTRARSGSCSRTIATCCSTS